MNDVARRKKEEVLEQRLYGDVHNAVEIGRGKLQGELQPSEPVAVIVLTQFAIFRLARAQERKENVSERLACMERSRRCRRSAYPKRVR